MNIPTRRHAVTLLYLLRGYAQEMRRTHGRLVEREGGLSLTPTECEHWAQEIEDECGHLLTGKQPAITPYQEAARIIVHSAQLKLAKVIIQPKAKKRGKK